MPPTQILTPIADDIYQAQLPLPFALRIVNCYLLRGSAGWTIVDTGIHTPDGEATWRSIFNELNITPAQIEQIVLTHVHPDHFGMAGWLQALAAEAGRNIPVRTSPLENEQVNKAWRSSDAYETFADYLIKTGMPSEMAVTVTGRMGDTRAMTFPHPPEIDLIQPGTTLHLGERQFQTIHAPGHSDGQLLFYDMDDQLLLSGDHVLMKITPNIGLWRKSDPNPLANFLNSLRELAHLEVRLALPGHKILITDWRGRIEELLHHHAERLQHTLTALHEGATTPYTVSLSIFNTEHFSPHEWRFALAESLAHLEYLRLRGEIDRAENGIMNHYHAV